MTGEQLQKLNQNPFYLQAHEFFMKEATTLLKLLEDVDFNLATAEKQKSVKFQCKRVKESRLVLQQFSDLLSAGVEQASERPQND